MKVLHIEDDAGIAGFIAKGLREAGHACDHAADGVDGLHMAREGGYDVWVVDRNTRISDKPSRPGNMRSTTHTS